MRNLRRKLQNLKCFLVKVIVFIGILVSANISHANETIKIAAFGDSLSAGFGLGPGESFPEQLQKALEQAGIQNVEIINTGNSGDTSADGLSRLDWSITDDIDAVILEFGANDGLRGLSVQEARANIAGMLNRFQERGIKVLLTGMEAPPNMGEEYRNEFRKIYSNLAMEYSVELYPFFLEGVVAEPDLNQADGIHPNKAGVKVIVQNILPKINLLIGSVTSN